MGVDAKEVSRKDGKAKKSRAKNVVCFKAVSNPDLLDDLPDMDSADFACFGAFPLVRPRHPIGLHPGFRVMNRNFGFVVAAFAGMYLSQTAVHGQQTGRVVVNVRDAVQRDGGEAVYARCREAGLEALLDDRDERPGVKFKDADLLGMPARITLGNAWAKKGVVEVRGRRTREERRVDLAGVATAVREVGESR